MKITQQLFRLKVNLNATHWNRRVWEKGYVGPPLPKRKGTGKPNLPVNKNAIAATQQALMREWNVMQWLANPYLNAEKERPWLERYGDILDQKIDEIVEENQQRMPNKSKIYKLNGEVEKRRANVGNMLHSHRTVESQMRELIRRSRWD